MNTYRVGAQRGMVLISSLLLLVVVTIIALSMFRSFGIQEKIGGNMREKQRALQAAVSAQSYAENWLSANATEVPTPCNTLLNANTNQGQICSNKLSATVVDITNVPWKIGTADIGVKYLPPGMVVSATTSVSLANPTYFDVPRFYISDLGPSADPNIPGEIYQVDAVAFGGSSSTAAVVESTYAVYTSSSNRTL
ncbi:MAG TPA: PilX N-terminal domain-containing pilus assembly protein [Steroidobacteraceae bacterium]|jgi:type IV pilus assembly protein PilX|nr:PilX N-terminal domain-containing pilus assembly protein [Steroidobacteraceae bacterium]